MTSENILNIVLKDKLTTQCRALKQYDHGIELHIFNTEINNGTVRFQFIQNEEQITQLGEYDGDNDCYKVNFPDRFLLNDNEVNCFVYLDGEDYGLTKKVINFQIFDREMFDEIPDVETQDLVGQLVAKVNELQEAVEGLNLSDEQLEYIASKIDLTGYVTTDQMGQALSNMNQSVVSITNALGERISNLETALSNLSTQVDEANAILEVV